MSVLNKETRCAATALAALLLALLLASCAGNPVPPVAPAAAETADATQPAGERVGEEETSAPAVSRNWTIALKGAREDVLEAGRFEQAKAHGSHYVERKLERKGEVKTYSGMPLYLIAAMVDGSDGEHPYRVDRSGWSAGYDVTITGRDGYAATFNTADVAPEALILADSEEGMPVAPMIAGEVPGSLWVRDVVEIELALGTAAVEEPEFELVLDINGKVSSFTLEELESSPFYIEQRGSYTTSAGTTYEGLWGGVKMPDFLGQFMNLKPETSLTMVAMDEYEMTYSGKEILDTSDGVWILAFKRDGEYLPVDPGYVRTLKVGPGVPNIPGHSSVRMVQRIVARQEGYRDFSITISGKMEWTLDRQTIQAGVSCHKRVVLFEREGESARYTGIPLYLVLAYADDPEYAPHKQADKSILSYRGELAEKGYTVEIMAADGFSISLDSRELDGNEDVILGMYKDGEELPEREFPLILVWDKDAKTEPAGAKPIRQITGIRLVF